MLFEELINKYPNTSIGILGSGPTLNDYKNSLNKNDLVIATNGSLMALDPKINLIDFFIYGDCKSPKRQWFSRTEIGFKGRNNNKTIRVLPKFLLPFDPYVLSDLKSRKTLEDALNKFKSENGENNYIYFNPSLNEFNIDGVIFNYCDLVPTNILGNGNYLSRGGTITGVAAQFAIYLGSTQINLYGCSFSNQGNIGNYAYKSKGEFGQTTNSQRNNMDTILKTLKEKKPKIEINSYGETNLKIPKIIF